jgi:hypothetical protein
VVVTNPTYNDDILRIIFLCMFTATKPLNDLLFLLQKKQCPVFSFKSLHTNTTRTFPSTFKLVLYNSINE